MRGILPLLGNAMVTTTVIKSVKRNNEVVANKADQENLTDVEILVGSEIVVA